MSEAPLQKGAPKQTSIYLTDNDQLILENLMERTGLRRSVVIRLALQKLQQDGPERQARLLEIAEEIRRIA